MTTPFISVLIDTYNHERYIEQCVASAVEQDFPASDYEIVVVDDGSTDRTPEIVAKFAPRVRLLRKKNGGQASAFNAAFPELRGEIVALLDGDDWFAPKKLDAVATVLEQSLELGAASHGYYEFHEDTKEAIARVPKEREFLILANRESAKRTAPEWPFLVIGALTVRRKVLEQALPISEKLVFCADGPIAWASMAMGTIVLEEPLCYYRHHDSNLHTIQAKNRDRARRKFEMMELMFRQTEPMLVRMGVSREAMLASFYPWWVLISRSRLYEFGGSRRDALRTEIRSFQAGYGNPTLAYRLFRYAVAAAAAVLPPRQFYGLWNWYGRQRLFHFPEQLRNGG